MKEAFDALMAELQTLRSRIGANSATADDCLSLRQAIKRAEEALDDATEIKAVPAGSFTTDKAIFNLAGQRVDKPGKGIYIVNGKKVLF